MPVNGPINENSIAYGAVMPWHEGLRVKNAFAGVLAVGVLVYVNSTTTDPSTGDDIFFTVTKADADAGAPADRAMYVVTEEIPQSGYGKVSQYLVSRGVDTSAATTVGDPAYLSATAGATTFTAPTNATVQRVGYVAKKSASAGIVVYNLRDAPTTVSQTSVQQVGAVSQAAATVTNAGTITVAQHRTQQVFQNASGGNVTMTTATATDLDTAFATFGAGNSLMLYCVSNHASNTSTLSGGAGVTLVGSGAFTQTGATFLLRKTGAAAWDLLRVG